MSLKSTKELRVMEMKNNAKLYYNEAKYILFELKKYRGVIFHETEEGYKIWGRIDSSFQNWHKEFDKI